MMRTLIGSALIFTVISLGIAPASLSWQENDEQAYHNKMAVLKVMLEGARMRAIETNDIQTLCLIMSIGNDVTLRYVQLNPDNEEMRNRLEGMRNDMTACLAVLYNKN
ncbi:MAG: hypothetical protein CMN98_09380 [Synechococcus sp. NP17]|nr:hypothetical protein [Synechococcus sp. NP17]